MLRFILALALPFIAASSALAITWDTVSLSFTVQKAGDTAAKSFLTAQSYLKLASARDGIPTRDLFVGYNEATGEICVVRISDQSIRYFIVYGLSGQVQAVNATASNGSVVASASVSTLTVSCASYFYDAFQKKADGTFKMIKRTVIGGDSSQNVTVIGTARIHGKRYLFP